MNSQSVEGVRVTDRCTVCNKEVVTVYNKALIPLWRRIYNWFFPRKTEGALCASCSFDKAMK